MDPDDEVELMNKIKKWEKSKCLKHKSKRRDAILNTLGQEKPIRGL